MGDEGVFAEVCPFATSSSSRSAPAATFLGRVDELKSSKLKGAPELHKTLVGRGLTEGKIAQVRRRFA
jgi:hypothetical protein